LRLRSAVGVKVHAHHEWIVVPQAVGNWVEQARVVGAEEPGLHELDRFPERWASFDVRRRLDYVFTYAGSMAAMKDPKWVEKRTTGPAGFATIVKAGPPSMTGSLVLWFVFSFVVSLFAGYLAGSVLAPGAGYLRVFQVVGASAFMGYSLSLLQNSIWYHRNWGTTFRSMADGLAYALVTAGVFGWLWPN
jgi:hypothetical protein